MKLAFVAGFFDPVKKALDEVYSEHQKNGSLIWIRQKGMNREVNLGEFSEQFFDRVKSANSVLVLLTVLRGREWVESSVRAMIEKAKSENDALQCELKVFSNAGDRKGVVEALENFELPSPDFVQVTTIRQRIPEGKILCVSLEGKTKIVDALGRAGFTEEAIEECFLEERIEGARNSNLMEHLSSRSKQHSHLLYAWEGLRTLKPEVKDKFEKCYEGQSAAVIAAMFKKWVMEGV